MRPLSELDLFIVGTFVAANLILGSVVFFGNYKSKTNLFFLLFAVANSFWSILNYLAYQFVNPDLSLWIIRLVMCFAVLQAFTFFMMIHTYPKSEVKLSKKYLIPILLAIFVACLTTLSPFMYSKVKMEGLVPRPVAGPGMVIFMAVAIPLVLSGITILIKRIKQTSGKLRAQFILLLLGALFMFALILCFNFVLVTFFENTDFIPFSALYMLPFVAFSFYAISKHQILNAKVVGAEILTFIVLIINFVDVIFADNLFQVMQRSIVFILLLILGILLIRSVAQEVEQKKRLEELYERLKRLDDTKNEFISVAAHELRAPLTAIKGYLSMVIDGDAGSISTQTKEFLQDSLLSNERMIRLVNNMLDVGRIEEGRIIYQEGHVKISELAKLAHAEFKLEAERKDLTFELVIAKDIKDKVYVDKDRLHEVIVNFLSNALKYTEEGKVTLNLRNPDVKTVRLEVIDTGPGVSDQEKKKLFNKFYRVSSEVGKTIGSGLGLYISKLLIQKFGGSIGVESKAGEGSNFWFELPVRDDGPSDRKAVV